MSACSFSSTPMSNTVNLSNQDFSNPETIKEGSSCSYYLFGILGPFGDKKIVDAIKDGGITKVMAVDYSIGYYIIVGSSCINVYGR